MAFEPEVDDGGYVTGPPAYARLIEAVGYGNISSNAKSIVEDLVNDPALVLDALVEAGAVVRIDLGAELGSESTFYEIVQTEAVTQ